MKLSFPLSYLPLNLCQNTSNSDLLPCCSKVWINRLCVSYLVGFHLFLYMWCSYFFSPSERDKYWTTYDYSTHFCNEEVCGKMTTINRMLPLFLDYRKLYLESGWFWFNIIALLSFFFCLFTAPDYLLANYSFNYTLISKYQEPFWEKEKIIRVVNILFTNKPQMCCIFLWISSYQFFLSSLHLKIYLTDEETTVKNILICKTLVLIDWKLLGKLRWFAIRKQQQNRMPFWLNCSPW